MKYYNRILIAMLLSPIFPLTASQQKTIAKQLTQGALYNRLGKNGRTLLMHFAIKGDAERVQRAIESGANVSIRDFNGDTALLYALHSNKIEIAMRLLEAGAEVNTANQNNITALMAAVFGGHTEIIQALIQANANLNAARTTDGATALMLAAEQGLTEILKTLIQANANLNAAMTTDGATALILAAEYGHTKIVQDLIQANADLNTTRTADGATALITAAFMGHTKITQALIKANADLNTARTADGATALIAAAMMGHTKIVQALIQANADLNAARTTDGATALIAATFMRHTEIIQALIQANANLNTARTSDGTTALILATEQGLTEILKTLIQANADFNAARTSDGATALILATEQGHTEILKTLIQANADLNAARTIDGATALILAAFMGHTEIAQALIRAGANVNASANEYTVLMIAAAEGHPEIVKILLKAGADPHAKAKNNWTAHRYASSRHHKQIVKILLTWKYQSHRENKITDTHHAQPSLDHIDETPATLPQTHQSQADFMEKLWQAVFDHHIDQVTHYIDQVATEETSIDPNWRDSNGDTVLIVAIKRIKKAQDEISRNRAKHILEKLLTNEHIKASIGTPGVHGKTPADILKYPLDTKKRTNTRRTQNVQPKTTDEAIIEIIQTVSPIFKGTRTKQLSVPQQKAPSTPAGTINAADPADTHIDQLIAAIKGWRSNRQRKALEKHIDTLLQQPKVLRWANGKITIDNQTTTLLHHALRNQVSENIFLILLKYLQAPLHMHDHAGQTPLDLALKTNRRGYIKAIVSRCSAITPEQHALVTTIATTADPHEKPYWHAIATDMAHKLPDINPAPLPYQAKRGDTPAERLAAIFERYNCNCENSQAAIDQRFGKNKTTVLMRAARTGDLKAVQALLDAGATVEITDKRGQTALAHALKTGHTQIANCFCIVTARQHFMLDHPNTTCRNHIKSVHCNQPTLEITNHPDYRDDQPFEMSLASTNRTRVTQFPSNWSAQDACDAVANILGKPDIIGENLPTYNYRGELLRGVIVARGKHKGILVKIIVSNIASNDQGIQQWRVFTAYPLVGPASI